MLFTVFIVLIVIALMLGLPLIDEPSADELATDSARELTPAQF